MKKKTTITTEKHEVWVIRQTGEPQESNAERPEPESDNASLPVLPEHPERDAPDRQEQ